MKNFYLLAINLCLTLIIEKIFIFYKTFLPELERIPYSIVIVNAFKLVVLYMKLYNLTNLIPTRSINKWEKSRKLVSSGKAALGDNRNVHDTSSLVPISNRL